MFISLYCIEKFKEGNNKEFFAKGQRLKVQFYLSESAHNLTYR